MSQRALPGKGQPPEGDRAGGLPAPGIRDAGASEVRALEGGPSCHIHGCSGSGAGYEVLGEVAVGLDPEGVAVDPRDGLAYAACSRSNHIAVVDLDRLQLIETIPVGQEPIDVVVDAVTDHVLTADARSDQLSVIDTKTRRVVAAVPVGVYPAGLGYDDAGRRLFVGDTMGCSVSVVDLDRLERVACVEAELGAGAVAYDQRHRRIFCVNFMTASVTVIDGDDLSVLRRLEVGEGPCAVAVNPLHEEVYFVNSLKSTIACFHSGTLEQLGEFAAPSAPVGLAAGPAGDRIYTGNRGAGSMSIMGTDGLEWARVPVGTAPGGVAVHPSDPRRLIVANAGSGSLTVVRDLLAGPPATGVADSGHPLVGSALPEFSLPELHGDGVRHSREWSEKKYILNFFASW